jgi:hypothetical protein
VHKFSIVRLLASGLFLFIPMFAAPQEQAGNLSRGSIPEDLLRPKRGEAPHYPIDIVIGDLGKGTASDAAFSFANYISAGLLSGNMENQALAGIESSLRESLLSSLEAIAPLNYRLGGGREEADGAVSFLIRFIGKDQGISGELYIRHNSGGWVFEELLLEEAKDRVTEQKESIYKNDFYPYERFY